MVSFFLQSLQVLLSAPHPTLTRRLVTVHCAFNKQASYTCLVSAWLLPETDVLAVSCSTVHLLSLLSSLEISTGLKSSCSVHGENETTTTNRHFSHFHREEIPSLRSSLRAAER